MLEYITTRELENSKGQLKGRVRIIKMKNNDFAEIEFVCPECQASEKSKKEWSSPFVEGSGKNQKFNLKCNKCGYSIKLMKLRKEIKKKR